MQSADLADFLVSGVLANERRGHRFQLFENIKHISRRLRSECGDNRSTAGYQLNQAFRRQHLEGFAQRCPRDAELFAELPFMDAHSGGQRTIDDHIPDSGNHDRVQCRTFDRDDFGSGGHVDGCFQVIIHEDKRERLLFNWRNYRHLPHLLTALHSEFRILRLTCRIET